VRRIADAVLYEGYLLWPYRHAALKNQRRWTFGGVHPPAWSAAHPDDRSELRTECLIQIPTHPADAQLDVHVRFLQVVKVAGRGDEAIEREAAAHALRLTDVATPLNVAIDIGPGVAQGGRSWRKLTGAVSIAAEPVTRHVQRLAVRVANTTPWSGPTREDALRQTFCSTHAVLAVHGAQFVSLTDPPVPLAVAAAACVNDGAWPVLVGEPGDRTTMLCSPIILSDYPQVAPESPGDLFDSSEIDQLLVLSILAMTDEEKAAMREADPRAREILERTEALTPEELMRLHGAVRELGMARR
jgi:hydrogenase maturation protease